MALRPRIPSLEDVTLIISNLEPKKSSLIYFVYSYRQSEVKSAAYCSVVVVVRPSLTTQLRMRSTDLSCHNMDQKNFNASLKPALSRHKFRNFINFHVDLVILN